MILVIYLYWIQVFIPHCILCTCSTRDYDHIISASNDEQGDDSSSLSNLEDLDQDDLHNQLNVELGKWKFSQLLKATNTYHYINESILLGLGTRTRHTVPPDPSSRPNPTFSNTTKKLTKRKTTPKDKKKHKKKRKPASSSSSDSSSTDSSEDSSDDSSGDEKSNWAVMHSIWPLEKRPIALQDKGYFNQMNLDQILALAKFDLKQSSAVESDLSHSFTRDKKPPSTTYKKEKDDSYKKLHPARFQRYPLSNIKDWWKKVPRIRSHQFKNLPLQFSGAHNKLTQKTIQLMHDRTKPLTFKHFHTGNLNVASKPLKKIEKREDDEVYSTLDFNWEAPSNLSQVTDALLNYSTVLMHLWPYDQTGLIIMRVLNKYNQIACAPTLSERVTVITSFFNLVLRENAARACRKEVILSFSEQEECLKTLLASSGLSSAVPTSRAPKPPGYTYSNDRSKFMNNRPNPFQPQTSGSGSSSSKVVMFRGYPICFGYNRGSCRNPPIPYGCKDQRGKEFAHQCNKWIHSRNTHCFEAHPSVNHR